MWKDLSAKGGSLEWTTWGIVMTFVEWFAGSHKMEMYHR